MPIRKHKMRVDALFEYLTTNADLRVESVDGVSRAILTMQSGEVSYKLPSSQFVETVDGILRDAKQPLATTETMVELSNVLITIAKSHDTEIDQDVEYEQNDLVIQENPKYISRMYGEITDIDLVKKAIQTRKSILLMGPPGCGKSLILRQVAFDNQIPFVSIDLSESFDSADIIGTHVKDGGNWKWRDGKLVTMLKYGGMFVMNEINSARAEVLTRFHELLEPQRQMTIIEHGGETITAHPDFTVFATANDSGEAGTRPLAPRFRERFNIVLNFTYDTEVESKLSGINPTILTAFQTMREDKRIKTPVSTRLLVTLIKNITTYGDILAIRLLMNVFRETERPFVLEAFKSARQFTLHSKKIGEEVVHKQPEMMRVA